MSDLDLFGAPVLEEPGYQSARSGPVERMFDFPVTLPGQMALGAPEGASETKPARGPCTWCGSPAAEGTCPRAVTCPRCQQGPGSPCLRPSGHPAAELHADRVELAERAA